MTIGRIHLCKLRSLAILLAVATVAIVAVQSAAGGGEGAVIVRGDQLIAGAENCPDADEGTYLMKGDLVGCWYTDTFEVRQEKDNPGGSFKASGTEHFVGCLDTNGSTTCDAGEPYGEFNLTFTYSAKFATTGEQIGPDARSRIRTREIVAAIIETGECRRRSSPETAADTLLASHR
jgi:hypothetical protein